MNDPPRSVVAGIEVDVTNDAPGPDLIENQPGVGHEGAGGLEGSRIEAR